MSDANVVRADVQVDGRRISYLTVEQDGPLVLLLHGTWWSRVWQPVLGGLADAGLRPVAVDFPGMGRSDGELDPQSAAVPALSGWVGEFADALGITGPVGVAGHDIGGGVAQHLAVRGPLEVDRLALVNAVMYDSWPVPGVARYRDPAVVAATTPEDLLASRREAVTTALGDAATDELIDDYLEPWSDPRVCRSWMAMAAAADARYTTGLVPALEQSPMPRLLVWGEDDGFQKVEFAERFAAQMPRTNLIRIPQAGHLPMENAPARVAAALAEFFTAA
ncbi:alpha/beta hydrolase [Tersicoccus sp. MR15.9]|uniref:alpha/beta fold hydrolase n=1 Tax=Tersicoccus mangrovi TaxID=3121635 RepID=UPI002FE60C52